MLTEHKQSENLVNDPSKLTKVKQEMIPVNVTRLLLKPRTCAEP